MYSILICIYLKKCSFVCTPITAKLMKRFWGNSDTKLVTIERIVLKCFETQFEVSLKFCLKLSKAKLDG